MIRGTSFCSPQKMAKGKLEFSEFSVRGPSESILDCSAASDVILGFRHVLRNQVPPT